jgi:hypothetical protein
MTLENIGPREAQKRLLFGLVALLIGVLGFVALYLSGADRFWRIILFAPFYLASLGYFQYCAKTCVRLASRGSCNFDAGETALSDIEQISIIQKRARAIYYRSIALSAILTALAIVVP